MRVCPTVVVTTGHNFASPLLSNGTMLVLSRSDEALRQRSSLNLSRRALHEHVNVIVEDPYSQYVISVFVPSPITSLE